MSVFIGRNLNDGLTVDELISKLQEIKPEFHNLPVVSDGIPLRWVDVHCTINGDPYINLA